MPSRYAQFKEKLPISRLSDEALLAFRVLFDDPLDIVDLAQDISDLTLYPERLKQLQERVGSVRNQGAGL